MFLLRYSSKLLCSPSPRFLTSFPKPPIPHNITYLHGAYNNISFNIARRHIHKPSKRGKNNNKVDSPTNNNGKQRGKETYNEEQKKAWLYTSMGLAAFVVVTCTGYVVVRKYWMSADEAPFTGRKRIVIATPETEKMFSKEHWKRLKQEHADNILPEDHPFTQQIKRVARQLIVNAKVDDHDWEVIGVEDENVNAVATRGKIMVFTGISKIAPEDGDMAVIIAHEIAHTLARHTAELPALYAEGNQIREKEADIMGLMIMSEACFDPRNAVDVWKRSKSLNLKNYDDDSADKSTHPSPKARIAYIKEYMAKAFEKREQCGCPRIDDKPGWEGDWELELDIYDRAHGEVGRENDYSELGRENDHSDPGGEYDHSDPGREYDRS